MLISIITVNYNDVKGLERTIKSVQEQSATNYEHIIIDGGSTDGSAALIEQYQDNFSYCVSEPDNGIYHAMNKGIAVARGEYLLFLNSGDTLCSEVLLTNVSLKIKQYIDIYYGDVIRVYENNKKVKKTYPKKLKFSFFIDSALAHQSVFIKKELFDRYFYYNEKFTVLSDWEFLIYCICKENVSYEHLDLFVSNYDMNGLSSSEEGKVIMKQERLITLNKYFPHFVTDYHHLIELQQKNSTVLYRRIRNINSLYFTKNLLNGSLFMLDLFTKVWMKVSFKK
jgi:glycosyltransferase involved in cell wall biosynthesis